MNSPPKKKNGRASNRPLIAWCQILRMVQSPFGWFFWLIEQKIAALDVEIERRA